MIESLDWIQTSQPLLRQAFSNYRPRAEFIRKKKVVATTPDNESFNIVGYKNVDLPLFEQTWHENSAYSLISGVFEELHSSVKLAKDSFSFITISTNILAHDRCPPHLHNFINKSPCRTTTFAVPLYIGKDMPSFYISKQAKKWPTRWYLDFNHIPKDLEYEKVEVKKDKILKLQFNSSFHPHFITYTDSVVMWLVIDGCEHQFDFECTEVDIDRLKSSRFNGQKGGSK